MSGDLDLSGVPKERIVSVDDVDMDFDWNSRSPANAASWSTSEVDEESSGLEGLVKNLMTFGQTTAVDVRSTAAPFYKMTAKPVSLVAGFRRGAALSTIYANAELKKEYEAKGAVPGLPWGKIRVRDHGPMTEREALVLNARENGARENLTAPDTLALVQRLKEHGLTPADMALALSKHPSAVAQYVKILKLPPVVLKHWREGGDFENVKSYKRVALLDLVELSKVRPTEMKDGYVKLLVDQAPKVDSNAWIEKARGRAISMGATLAKLQKMGFLTVHAKEADWVARVAIMVRVGQKNLRFSEVMKFSKAAELSFNTELARVDTEVTESMASNGLP